MCLFSEGFSQRGRGLRSLSLFWFASSPLGGTHAREGWLVRMVAAPWHFAGRHNCLSFGKIYFIVPSVRASIKFRVGNIKGVGKGM